MTMHSSRRQASQTEPLMLCKRGRSARRRLATGARVLAAAAVSAGLAATSAGAAPPPPPCNPAADALCKRELASLASFTGWLQKYGAQGYIGEVGWPTYPKDDTTGDGYLWNQLGELWFQAADKAGLPVTGWAAGEWYEPTKNTNIYEHEGDHAWPLEPLTARRIQADVFEAHYGALGGVNSVGGEGTPSGFSNKNLGIYDTHYHYDSQQSFHYLAANKVKVVRLMFRWERMQPTLGGPIDTTGQAFTQLKAAIGRANQAGLKVIVEPHNFGAYMEKDAAGNVGRKPIGVGVGDVPISQFGDFWKKLATELKNVPGLLGYGLMNEPYGLRSSPRQMLTAAGVWEAASSAAYKAIRGTDGTHTIYVPAYAWDGVRSFAACHPKGPWITGFVHNVRYEAHQYFDFDGSGAYANGNHGYATEKNLASTKTQGSPSC